jgi:hypothetical protein
LGNGEERNGGRDAGLWGHGSFYMEPGNRVGGGAMVGGLEWPRLLGRLGRAMLGRTQRVGRAD